MMQRIWSFFKHPKVLTIIGIFVLMLVIYAIAPLLKLTGAAQLNVALLIGGLALLFASIIWIKNYFQERKLAAELRGQSSEQRSRAGESEKKELEGLEKEFDRAIQELARIKPGAQIFKAGSSDSLPWIAIIGPPGAGKSTVLDRSGLRFTRLGRRVKGIGGTRSCVFWLAEEAIFIDTAGRYTVQEEDHDEWLGFLKLLRKCRKERPLDAAILQIGLDEIINLSQSEIEQTAQHLRDRLDELITNLQVRFPVYLVFNKLDRLEGFAEYFGGLVKNEIHEPWGFAIDAQQLGSGPVAPLFEEHFDELILALEERSTHRILNLTSREHREVVLSFPQELARHREALQLFTDILFEPSKHRERPWLAAVHFVSAAQEGRTLPSVRHTLLNEQGLNAPPLEAPQRGERPYFVAGMFSRLVQEAKDAARPSNQALRSMKISRAATVISLAPFCAALSWLLADSFLLDQLWLRETVSAVKGLEEYRDLPSQVEKIERDYLVKELDLQKGVENLLRVQESSGLIAQTYERADGMLKRRVDDKWIFPLSTALDRRLDEGSTWRPGADEKLFADGFLALKAEHVLSRRMCQGADPEATRAWASQYLAGVWREEFGERANDLLAGTAPVDLQERLEYFFEGTASSRVKLNDAARDSALRALKGQTSLSQGQISNEVVFSLILANTNLTSLEQQLDGELLYDPGMKKVYTIDGCEKFLGAANSGKEWWSCLLDINNPPAIDRDKTYLDKYVEARRAWLKALSEAPFKRPIQDIAGASQAYNALMQPQTSELDQVLEIMGGNAVASKAGRRKRSSNLIPETTGILGRLKGCMRRMERYDEQLEKEGIATPLAQVCRQAQQKFTPFALALKEEDKSSIPVSYLTFKETMGRLRDRLNRIHRSANRPTEALSLVVETMNAQGELYELSKNREDFITQLRGGTPQIDPEPLDKLLMRLEARTWAVLIPEAAQALQDAWTTEVFQEWNDIRYRGARDKENEASACNRIKGFIAEKLEPYLDKQFNLFYVGNNLRGCQVKEFMGERMPLLPGVCREIDSTIQVSRTLECQDGGGGGEAAKPGLPDTFEAGGQECQFPVEWVEIDTTEVVYKCITSSGKCFEQSARKSSGKARLVVKRKNQGNAGLEYYSGYSYENLLAQGSKRGARVEWSIKQENCKTMSAIVFLVGGSEGKPGKKMDTRYQSLSLPIRVTPEKQSLQEK